VAYENLYNKIRPTAIRDLKSWVGHVKCENRYKEIDNLFSSNILTLESKIKSKNLIKESLIKKPQTQKETIKVPLKTMINVANKTVGNFISSLSEGERKELKKLLSESKDVIEKKYNNEKKIVLEKLNSKKIAEKESETIRTIDQVIEKLQKESFSEIAYFKLKNLNEGL